MTPEDALGIKQPATEDTLQSIDSTLKRIEKLLSKESNVEITAEGIASHIAGSLENVMNGI